MRFSMSYVKCAALALLLALALGTAAAADWRPHMLYFYNPNCRLCTHANEAVGAAEQKYKGRLGSQRFNIADPNEGTDNVLYMFELLDELQEPDNGNITLIVVLGLIGTEDGETVFIPKKALIEGENIIPNLDAAVQEFLKNPGTAWVPSIASDTALAAMPPPADEEQPPAQVVTRPRPRSGGGSSDRAAAAQARAEARAQAQLQFWVITGAALADSVNPCAFATIIILVAMMTTAKRTRREIILVCLSFTAAVYVTYFCIGLFLYKVIAVITEQGGTFLVIADIIYYIAFAICVVCGLLSLRDAIYMFMGRSTEEMTLKLPKAFKKRINVAMAKGVRAEWLAAGVFVAGVTVSFFEAACTGQVYLPAIISVAKLEFWHSILLLVWYNFLFVVPLLIIFGLVLWGVSSQQLADFFKKNAGWTRLALAVVFFVMGAALWFEMSWPPGYRG